MTIFYSASSRGFYDDQIHSAIPGDAVEITADQHAELIAGQAVGKRIVADPAGRPMLVDPPPLTDEQVAGNLSDAVQRFLDAAARAQGYDDIRSAVTYADEPAVPKFQAEGQALRAWRSLVWARCYEVLDAVKAGSRAVPTEAELIGELPALVMP